MKREVLIHKVSVKRESVFDYQIDMKLGIMPKRDIKILVEDYLEMKAEEFQDCNVRYFSLKYYDESVDDYLKLFFYKGKRWRKMQIWNLVGVCKYDDYDKDMEYEGIIRAWLNGRIGKHANKSDWVRRERLIEEFNRLEWEWQEAEWEKQYGEHKEYIK